MSLARALADDNSVAQGGDAALDARFVEGLLTLAEREARVEQCALPDLLGIDEQAIDLLTAFYPSDPARRMSLRIRGGARPGPDESEKALIGLLSLYAARGDLLGRLSPLIFARRCQRPHHLWQDLGLANRGELGALIETFFPRLKMRNSGDMKWKKFFYRQLCTSSDFGLCTSPICSDCDDYDDCFGEETGRPLLSLRYGGDDDAR